MVGLKFFKNVSHDPDHAHLRVGNHAKANTFRWLSLPVYKIQWL